MNYSKLISRIHITNKKGYHLEYTTWKNRKGKRYNLTKVQESPGVCFFADTNVLQPLVSKCRFGWPAIFSLRQYVNAQLNSSFQTLLNWEGLVDNELKRSNTNEFCFLSFPWDRIVSRIMKIPHIFYFIQSSWAIPW